MVRTVIVAALILAGTAAAASAQGWGGHRHYGGPGYYGYGRGPVVVVRPAWRGYHGFRHHRPRWHHRRFGW